MKTSVINVPGKILFFGGYSVLENNHPALSFAVLDNKDKGVAASVKESPKDMLVSKQFNIEKAINLNNLNKENVATTAFFLARLYLESKGFNKKFTVELANSPMFGIDHKSGLGSSAAATVAVVKSLFAANNISLISNSDTLHKLAQYCYAVYSGKIGSGFDIATCSEGKSIIYKRFVPNAIELPSDFNDNHELLEKLIASIGKKWDGLAIEKLDIPSKYSILFFKIEGGDTATISNVKAVMEWKSKHKDEYLKLMRKQKGHEAKAIDALVKGSNSILIKQTHGAREIHRTLQDLVKSDISNFDPIEPEPLTKLIEFGESSEGIVAGRCPGAGGWDGLAFIVDKKKFAESSIKKIIKQGQELGLKVKHIPLRLL